MFNYELILHYAFRIRNILVLIIISFLTLQPLLTQEADHYNWLLKQRMYPIDSIKMDAYTTASQHQTSNSAMNGYHIQDPWTCIGPPISGSGAGRVTSVKYDPDFDPINRPYIYCTGHNGGVWKSTNAGTTFFPITDALPTQSSGVITIDPNNPNIIYYATGGSVEGFKFNYYGFGVFKSTDAGISWTGGYNVHYPKVTYSYALEVNPNNSNNLYLAERTGFFISSDAGVTWNAPYGYGSCQDVSTSSDGQIICAIGGGNEMFWPPTYPGMGYFRSSDYGATFTEMTNYGFTPATRTHISVSWANKNYVYAVTRSGNIYSYTSTDGGITFSRFKDMGSNWSSMSADFMFVEASPHDPEVAIVGYGTGVIGYLLWKTTDGGQNWNQLYFPGADVNCLTFNPNVNFTQEALCGFDQGLVKSTDNGNTWPVNFNSTLLITENYRISTYYDANVNLLLGAVTDMGFTRSTDGGNNWEVKNPYCDGTNIVISQLDPSSWNNKHVVGSKGTCNSPFSYSIDAYNNYNASDLSGAHDWIAAYYEDPHIPGIFFCPTLGAGLDNDKTYINVTTNYGQNWYRSRVNGQFSYVPTDNPCQQPQTFTMSAVDTNLLFFSSNDYYPPEIGCLLEGQMLWRSLDAGQNWTLLNRLGGGLPDRFITSVVTDPVNADIVYLTVSGLGYGTGHVFKSLNKGTNWYDISGSGTSGLPDIPVNCLEIRSINDAMKELIIGTDNGVYVAIDNDISVPAPNIAWSEYASGLPRTPVLDIEINYALAKIRCASFGRSIFESSLSGPWVVAGAQNIIKGASDLKVNSDIIVESNGIMRIPNSCTIRMKEGKKIIIEPGGQIDVSSGASVTFTSQSGTWDGIEFNGIASGTLKNCTFSNTTTPVVINGGLMLTLDPPAIVVDDCHFTNCAVEVTNRPGVTIKHNDWTINNGTQTDAILASGSGGIYIWNNEITYTSQVPGSHGIQLSQCGDATITQNTITNADYPVTVSNATSYIRYSNISTSYESTSYEGIYLNGVNNGHLIANDVSGYQTGYYLNYYSSPQMLSNNADGYNASGNKTAIYCFGSSPRMYPAVNGADVTWDAGLNTLRNDAGESIGMYLEEDSQPDLNYGYNTIFGATNISGTYPFEKWEVRCNTWENDPPVFTVYNPAIEYYPTDCTPPDSRPGNQKMLKAGAERNAYVLSDPNDPEEKETTPPQPIIVNYGNGLFDTLIVSSGAPVVTADVLLLGSGIKQVYLNNFEMAIGIFENVISNYKDSSTAIPAMDRIFYCHSRMNSDSAEYAALRAYYLNLASVYSEDTSFTKMAMELSRKCLTKQKNYIAAISAYEDVVSNSADPTEAAAAEISIIEIYMLMNSAEGDSPSFTGRYSALKPHGLKDAMKKIREKMGHKEGSVANINIPKEFSLSQNYPNPFNPLTKINYSVSQNITVTLKVYDILGRLVKTLVNEYQNAGNYTVTFDGSGLASGIYFYKIEAGDYVQSKKMVLVK